MQTKGGVMAQSGGKIEKFWPKKHEALLTFLIVCMFIDQGIECSSPPGLQIMDQGHLAG